VEGWWRWEQEHWKREARGLPHLTYQLHVMWHIRPQEVYRRLKTEEGAIKEN